MNESPWISVELELPTEGMFVFVTVQSPQPQAMCAKRVGHQWQAVDSDGEMGFIMKWPVSHWMRIPALYMEVRC